MMAGFYWGALGIQQLVYELVYSFELILIYATSKHTCLTDKLEIRIKIIYFYFVQTTHVRNLPSSYGGQANDPHTAFTG